jgi:hypothetical protein
MTSCRYDKKFYETNFPDSKTSAQLILSHVLEVFPAIESAVDVGCGTGVWLAVLKEKGVKTIQGYDGAWVLGAEALAIPRECFFPADLNRPLEADRTFDLAISVEVAEHLEPTSSATFVHTLTRLSDLILFSAAVPGQGGTNHINEQWPAYWVDLFRHESFEVVDLLRSVIWDEPQIPYWYRQNLLVFINNRTKSDLVQSLKRDCRPPLCLIHPDLYLFKDRFFRIDIMTADISARAAFKLFLIRLKKAIERRIPGRTAKGQG